MAGPMGDGELERWRGHCRPLGPWAAVNRMLARLDAAEAERDALRQALRNLRDAAEGLEGVPPGSGVSYARALVDAGRLLGEGP